MRWISMFRLCWAGLTVCPVSGRCHFGRVPPFKTGPRNFPVVGPGDVRDVPVLDGDCVKCFGGRTRKTVRWWPRAETRPRIPFLLKLDRSSSRPFLGFLDRVRLLDLLRSPVVRVLPGFAWSWKLDTYPCNVPPATAAPNGAPTPAALSTSRLTMATPGARDRSVIPC